MLTLLPRIFFTAAALFSLIRFCKTDANEYRLIRNLLADYDATVRPVSVATRPLRVIFGMSLHLIVDVDERGQILTTNCWLTQKWNDTHLKWNATDYGGINVVRIPYYKVWRPDVILYNNADAQYSSSVINTNVIVSENGQVVWLSHGIFRSSCDINVEFFPFDIQICKMKWASWTYDGFQIELLKQTEGGDLSNYQTNGEFDLIDMEAIHHEQYYSCCPEPYPDITYVIKMRRRPLFYVFNLILPCILINSIALLVFYVPSESGEKVTLGISSLLSMTVFLMTIRESLPPTEKTPLISLYYGVSICLVSFASGLSVVTLNLHHRGLRGTEVPCFVRRVVLGGLARVMRLRFDVSQPSNRVQPINQSARHLHLDASPTPTNRVQSGDETARQRSKTVWTTDYSNDVATTTNCGVRLDTDGAGKFIASRDLDRSKCPSPHCKRQRQPPTGSSASTSASFDSNASSSTPSGEAWAYEQRLSNLLARVAAVVESSESRVDDQERRDALQLEWKQVALVCDRVLLLLFFAVTAVATCLILMSSPYGP